MRNGYAADTILELPGGLLHNECWLRQAELRPLSGVEEEWLARHKGASSAEAVTRLLSSCVLRLDDIAPTPDLVQQMLVGDRDFLMLHLRRITLGDTIQAVLVCPACNAKFDVDFRAADVPVERRPQTTAIYSCEFGADRDRSIRFRLPSGADQEAVVALDAERAVEVLLDRCLVGDGNVSLMPDERMVVSDAIERRAPQVDLELDVTCPECAHAFVLPFDTTAFFLHEMQINGDHLLREVHLLALYYHWSEADILGLTRNRRRAYLDLLSDTLRQD